MFFLSTLPPGSALDANPTHLRRFNAWTDGQTATDRKTFLRLPGTKLSCYTSAVHFLFLLSSLSIFYSFIYKA